MLRPPSMSAFLNFFVCVCETEAERDDADRDGGTSPGVTRDGRETGFLLSRSPECERNNEYRRSCLILHASEESKCLFQQISSERGTEGREGTLAPIL